MEKYNNLGDIMKKYKLRRKIKNKLLLVILFISFLSIIFGIMYLSIISNNDKLLINKTIKYYFNNLDKINYKDGFIKCFLTNSFYTLFIWILGISIIGIPLILCILIIKSFILGFSVSSILYFYKLKGIIIAIFYLIPLVINLLSIIYISYYSIVFSKNLNKLLFSKKEIIFKNIMKKYFKILVISLFIITISSILEIFIIPYILKLLQI